MGYCKRHKWFWEIAMKPWCAYNVCAAIALNAWIQSFLIQICLPQYKDERPIQFRALTLWHKWTSVVSGRRTGAVYPQHTTPLDSLTEQEAVMADRILNAAVGLWSAELLTTAWFPFLTLFVVIAASRPWNNKKLSCCCDSRSYCMQQ